MARRDNLFYLVICVTPHQLALPLNKEDIITNMLKAMITDGAFDHVERILLFTA